MSDDYEMPPDSSEVDWKINAEGRAWDKDEAFPRYYLRPEKAELINGKIYWSDADRLRMLGLLLENCGAEAVVHLGDPNVWRKVVAALDDPEKTLRFAVRTALRRLADLSGYDAKGAVRFWEQTVSVDFAWFDTPEQTETPTYTRETLIALWQSRTRNDASSDWDNAEAEVERVAFSDETRSRATVWIKQTTEQQRWAAVSENQRRSLPTITLMERWRDEWQNEDGVWKWRRRECVERFSV